MGEVTLKRNFNQSGSTQFDTVRNRYDSLGCYLLRVDGIKPRFGTDKKYSHKTSHLLG